MDRSLRAAAEAAKGFMPPDEGLALYEAALEGALLGPVLEIGTYCGKSAVYLGAAARVRNTVVFTIDHHRGSEEMQSEWDHHDPEVVDPSTGRIDSLPFFRHTIAEAGLEDVVVGIVGNAPTIARYWTTPLGLVFIDGAHSDEPALIDYESWGPKLVTRGLLAIHDVFESPDQGGQGPFRVYERAKKDAFTDASRTGSLRVVRAP